jgi:hypothetical protein
MPRFLSLPTFLVLAVASGCALHLNTMAKERGQMELGCDKEELKVKMSGDKPPYSKWRVEGCGRWIEYRGTCEANINGCDALARDPSCEGTCNLDKLGSGDLDPEEVAKEAAEAKAKADAKAKKKADRKKK